MLNIFSVTKYPFINFHSRVCECMPLQDITTEFVGPEARKDGYKRLTLSWIPTCPGRLSGERTIPQLEIRVQVPVHDRISLFRFYIQATDGLVLKTKFPDHNVCYLVSSYFIVIIFRTLVTVIQILVTLMGQSQFSGTYLIISLYFNYIDEVDNLFILCNYFVFTFERHKG